MDTIASLVFFVASLAIGGWLGERFRGNATAGTLLGLLGPLGWAIIPAIQDRRQKCPECRTALNPGARRCHKCRAEIRAQVARG